MEEPEAKPAYELDIKTATCLHCGKECQAMWDYRISSYVSFCHGVGFDYETSKGEVETENDELRYIDDWADYDIPNESKSIL